MFPFPKPSDGSHPPANTAQSSPTEGVHSAAIATTHARHSANALSGLPSRSLKRTGSSDESNAETSSKERRVGQATPSAINNGTNESAASSAQTAVQTAVMPYIENTQDILNMQLVSQVAKPIADKKIQIPVVTVKKAEEFEEALEFLRSLKSDTTTLKLINDASREVPPAFTADHLAALPLGIKHLKLVCFGNAYEKLNEFDCGKGLESLDLSDSGLSGAATLEILKETPHLKSLNLKRCRALTVEEINQLPSNKELESLDLSDSGLSEAAIIALLEKTPNLTSLNLGGRWLSRECISEITKQVPNLRVLTLGRCIPRLNGPQISALTKLRQLESLELHSAIVPAQYFAMLAGGVKKLDLSGCIVDGDLKQKKLPKLTQLTSLILKEARIPPNILDEVLCNAPNVEEVDLRGAATSTLDSLLGPFKTNLASMIFVSLKSLKLGGTRDVGCALKFDTFATLVLNMPAVEHLSVYSCYLKSNLSDLSSNKLADLANSLTKLTSVNFERVTFHAALLIAMRCVKELNLSACKVTEDIEDIEALEDIDPLEPLKPGPLALGPYFPSLKSLNLDGTPIPGQILIMLLYNMSYVEHMILYGYSLDNLILGLKHSPGYLDFPNLKSLKLQEAQQTPFPISSLALLLRNTPNLEEFELSGCVLDEDLESKNLQAIKALPEFAQLTSLKLEKIKIFAKSLAALLHKILHVKSLSFAESDVLEGRIEQNDLPQFTQLTSVNVDKMTAFSHISYATLLALAKKVNEGQLTSTNAPKGDLNKPTFVNFSGLTISADYLAKQLHENVKTLDLRECVVEGDLKPEDLPDLSQVTYVNLIDFDASSDTFTALTEKLPENTKIDL